MTSSFYLHIINSLDCLLYSLNSLDLLLGLRMIRRGKLLTQVLGQLVNNVSGTNPSIVVKLFMLLLLLLLQVVVVCLRLVVREPLLLLVVPVPLATGVQGKLGLVMGRLLAMGLFGITLLTVIDSFLA